MDTLSAWAEGLRQGVGGALATGSPMAYLLVFAAGIVASLTPCVYPIIPVTIAVIGGRTKRGPWEGLALSLCYALGIATTYALIGAGFAALRYFAGASVSQSDLSRSPWVAGAISVVCLLFAMVMMDKLTIPVPARIQQWQSQSRGGGYLGVFVAGIVFGTVASPCLAPVVGLIAVEVAKTGRVLYGASMLFTFGLGLGVLFVIVGTFSGALSSLPKAGAWMDRIKSGFAWLMLAISLAYMYQAGKLKADLDAKRAEQAAPISAPHDVGAAPSASSAVPAPPYRVGAAGAMGKLDVGAGPGSNAPDAALAGADGAALSLSDLWRRETVVLVFYASWCKNCPAEVPHANDLARGAGDRATVLGVGTTDSTAKAQSWATEHGVRYPLLFDPDGKLLEAYHPEDPGGLPWVVILGRDGKLLYRDVSWPANAEALVEQGSAAQPNAGMAVPPAGTASAGSSTGPVPSSSAPSSSAGPPFAVVSPVNAPEGGVRPGGALPDITLEDASGATVALLQWAGGEGLVLCLYAGDGVENSTRVEAANQLAKTHSGKVQVLAFCGATSAAEAGVWLAENGAEQVGIADPTSEAWHALAPPGSLPPWFIFADRSGKVLYAGAWPGNAEELAGAAARG